ncbi:MAG: AmpG family muropeptide MFS transporter [Ignavibacterium sp.]|nr:AmpG family muropeptide MFS transporter [Ignavibacterium sp.]MDW8376258.1 AmpG family muropeptide MFS transporter [Ignavibacteriales bacterium]
MNQDQTSVKRRNPWFWIPTLYYAQGIPYVIAMSVSVIMYKKLEISNTDIALYTSWLYLPWVIKPLWSPFVDLIGKKRNWVIFMQLLIGGGLAGVALTIPIPNFFQYSLAFLWLLAFSSATHDIAADGFYMLGLSQGEQSFFVGIRSTFYRLSMITGQGLLVILAGFLEESTGNIPLAWSITFFILAGLFIGFFIYHKFILPYPPNDFPAKKSYSDSIFENFIETFAAFFKRKNIGIILGFILLYRLAESQLVKIAAPFLLDSKEVGGLGLTTSEVGLVYGTIGILCLTLGGILGGIVISNNGLKYWLWPMILSINVPDLLYVLMAYVQSSNLWFVGSMVALEQFGYGFGFTAYMLYLIYISDGEYKTSHYAIATGFMALGMMVPGMWSGWLQELIGYKNFFIWICIATIPGFIMAKLVKIDPEFGRKTNR